MGLLHLLGRRQRDEPAVVEGVEQDLVRHDVQLLLHLALDVLLAGRAPLSGEAGARERARDALAGDAEAHEEERELARRARKGLLFLQDEAIERDRRNAHFTLYFVRCMDHCPVATVAAPVVVKVPSMLSPLRTPTNVVCTSQSHAGSR